jgi:IS1 family transposase
LGTPINASLPRIAITPSVKTIERWFNTLRQRLARFVRKTLAFSKSDHFHEFVFRLFAHHYNLERISQ